MSVVVITGSTKGVGFGLAKEYAKRGWSVVISGRSQDTVDDALGRLAEAVPGAKAAGLPVDVSQYDQQQALWDLASSTYGRVDLWINNAGLAISTKPIVDNTPDEVRGMVTTNVLGTMNGSKVAAAGMLAQGGGRIVNILGGGSDGRGRPLQAIYNSTKRGLDMFTRRLAGELEGTAVKVASVRPGILITEGFLREIQAQGPEEFAKQRKALNILGDRPDDVIPWIVEQLEAKAGKNGAEIAWLSTPKIIGRFSTAFKKRDILTEFGV